MKRLAFLALLPLVPLALVRPVSAGTAPVYDSYGLTALASGVRTAGDVGASGGLVTLDTGSASVSGRLDSSPSGSVLAAPFEPGTFARTLAGQGNDAAGDEVFDVPDAEAAYPGTPAGDLSTVPTSDQGGFVAGGGSATARATERSVSGSATGAALDLAGAVVADGSTSAVTVVADPVKGTAAATGRVTVSRVVVAGLLELRDVVASASVVAVGDTHTPFTSLSVGSASVGGQEVGLTDQGVVAAGVPVLPATTLQEATAMANDALAAAGVSVSLTAAVRTATTRSTSADTGGVRIALVTPDLPGGLAGNRLEVVVGGIALTEVDALSVPSVSLPPVAEDLTVVPGEVPVTTTTVVPGTPGSPAVPGISPPEVAPSTLLPASYSVLGRRISDTAALAAFGVWQFLTLGSVSLYALWDRRRREALCAPSA